MWGDIESRLVPLERARFDLDSLEARARAILGGIAEEWARVRLSEVAQNELIEDDDTIVFTDTGARSGSICVTLTGCCSLPRISETVTILDGATTIGSGTTNGSGILCIDVPQIGGGKSYTIHVDAGEYAVINQSTTPTGSPFNVTAPSFAATGYQCFGPCILDETTTLTLDGSGCDSTIGLLTPFYSGTFNWVTPDAAYSALGLGSKAWISNEFFTFPFAPPRQQTCQMHLTLTSPCNIVGIELIFKHTNNTDGNETRLDTGLTASWSDPGNTCNPVVMSEWIDGGTGDPCDMVLGE